MPRQTLIQVRGGTAAEWAAANPVLALNEPGYEEDTGVLKFGDGVATWATLGPSAAGGIPVGSGLWYGGGNSALGASALAVNNLIAYPVRIGRSCILDRLAINVTVLAAASVHRLGLYASNVNGAPSSLILDAGTVDTTTTGVKELIIAQAVSAGILWVAGVNQGGMPTITSLTSHNELVGSSTNPLQAPWPGLDMTGVAGALPGTFVSAGATAAAPRITFRIV